MIRDGESMEEMKVQRVTRHLMEPDIVITHQTFKNTRLELNITGSTYGRFIFVPTREYPAITVTDCLFTNK